MLVTDVAYRVQSIWLQQSIVYPLADAALKATGNSEMYATGLQWVQIKSKLERNEFRLGKMYLNATNKKTCHLLEGDRHGFGTVNMFPMFPMLN